MDSLRSFSRSQSIFLNDVDFAAEDRLFAFGTLQVQTQDAREPIHHLTKEHRQIRCLEGKEPGRSVSRMLYLIARNARTENFRWMKIAAVMSPVEQRQSITKTKTRTGPSCR